MNKHLDWKTEPTVAADMQLESWPYAAARGLPGSDSSFPELPALLLERKRGRGRSCKALTPHTYIRIYIYISIGRGPFDVLILE